MTKKKKPSFRNKSSFKHQKGENYRIQIGQNQNNQNLIQKIKISHTDEKCPSQFVSKSVNEQGNQKHIAGHQNKSIKNNYNKGILQKIQSTIKNQTVDFKKRKKYAKQQQKKVRIKSTIQQQDQSLMNSKKSFFSSSKNKNTQQNNKKHPQTSIDSSSTPSMFVYYTTQKQDPYIYKKTAQAKDKKNQFHKNIQPYQANHQKNVQIVGRLSYGAFQLQVKKILPKIISSNQQSCQNQHNAHINDKQHPEQRDFESQIKAELGVFTKLVSRNIDKYHILTNNKLWVIDNAITSFEGNTQHSHEFRKILIHMSSSEALQQLNMRSNNPQSLLMFSHIRFQNLIRMTLTSSIQSLQPLTWIECPQLKFLTVQNSKVTTLRSVYKTNYSHLCYLRVIGSPIASTKLNRLKIRKGSNLNLVYSLQPYQFRNFHNMQQMIVLQDISELCKSETLWHAFTRSFKFCKNRINQIKIVLKMNVMNRIRWEDQSADDNSSDSY